MSRPAARKTAKVKLDEAALVRRFSTAASSNLPHASAEASTLVADWLRGAAKTPAGKRLASLFEQHSQAAGIVAGIAESAPYLWDLIGADAARLLRLLTGNPDREFGAALTNARRAAQAARSQAALMGILRRLKGDTALLIALADIGGVWSVEQVTRALTELADTALGIAIFYLLGDAARRGHLAPPDPGHPEIGSGYVVLAMGKMGAHELNFSSDIDLIVLFDPAAAALPPHVEPGPFFVRLTRELVKIMQERTADGYVFRVDLRLRPDPSSTQIAISIEAALDYYESRGQNWERAAMIKARACAGDISAGDKILGELAPFVWRKYLDFDAFSDLH